MDSYTLTHYSSQGIKLTQYTVEEEIFQGELTKWAYLNIINIRKTGEILLGRITKENKRGWTIETKELNGTFQNIFLSRTNFKKESL